MNAYVAARGTNTVAITPIKQQQDHHQSQATSERSNKMIIFREKNQVVPVKSKRELFIRKTARTVIKNAEQNTAYVFYRATIVKLKLKKKNITKI